MCFYLYTPVVLPGPKILLRFRIRLLFPLLSPLPMLEMLLRLAIRSAVFFFVLSFTLPHYTDHKVWARYEGPLIHTITIVYFDIYTRYTYTSARTVGQCPFHPTNPISIPSLLVDILRSLQGLRFCDWIWASSEVGGPRWMGCTYKRWGGGSATLVARGCVS